MRLPGKIKFAFLAVIFMAAMLSISSCDRLHENLEPCKTGLRLRFVYDYNMDFANAFPSQVDCLTLLVYDSDGNYIETRTAFKDETSDENWRMVIDLAPGTYSMHAYGGLQCEEASFAFVNPPAEIREDQLQVSLDPQYLSVNVDKPLHHLYYGALDITIPEAGAGTTYTDGTVYMIKDTNDIRIILANDHGLPTDEADFDFSIIDNNTLLDWRNIPVEMPAVTYHPWAKGNVIAGLYASDIEAQMAYAEISTSRLMRNSGALLRVTRVSDGSEVIRIPLVNILLLLKSERYRSMGDQEFLDRQSMWNLTFFLTQSGEWLKTSIVVNDWLVRINNIEE